MHIKRISLDTVCMFCKCTIVSNCTDTRKLHFPKKRLKHFGSLYGQHKIIFRVTFRVHNHTLSYMSFIIYGMQYTGIGRSMYRFTRYIEIHSTYYGKIFPIFIYICRCLTRFCQQKKTRFFWM